MKKIQRIIITTSVVSVLILTGCTSKETKSFKEYIEKGDYIKAATYYEKNESSIEVDLSGIISDSVNSIMNDFSSGNITLSAASANIKALSSIAPEDQMESLNEKLGLLSSIESSQEQYRLGVESFDSKYYSEAVMYFSNVIEQDPFYSDAQSKLSMAADKLEEEQQVLLNQAEEEIGAYITQEKYKEANEAFNSFKSQCSDSSVIESLSNEIEKNVESAMNKAVTSYFADYDFSSAYSYVQDLAYTFEFESISDKLNSLEDDFVSYALAEAEKDADSENYESASAVIETAMQEIGEDNEALNAAYNEYQSYLPVFLADLSTLSYDGKLHIDTADDIRDNTGVLHRHSLFLRNYQYVDGWTALESYAEYFTNGKYSIFSGVCGVSNNKKSATGRSSYFQVFGDGELIYTSPTMTPGSLPVEFNIDISNVRVLKIWYPRTESGEGWDNAISVIYDGLLTPKKKSTEATTQEETAAQDE